MNHHHHNHNHNNHHHPFLGKYKRQSIWNETKSVVDSIDCNWCLPFICIWFVIYTTIVHVIYYNLKCIEEECNDKCQFDKMKVWWGSNVYIFFPFLSSLVLFLFILPLVCWVNREKMYEYTKRCLVQSVWQLNGASPQINENTGGWCTSKKKKHCGTTKVHITYTWYFIYFLIIIISTKLYIFRIKLCACVWIMHKSTTGCKLKM